MSLNLQLNDIRVKIRTGLNQIFLVIFHIPSLGEYKDGWGRWNSCSWRTQNQVGGGHDLFEKDNLKQNKTQLHLERFNSRILLVFKKQ